MSRDPRNHRVDTLGELPDAIRGRGWLIDAPKLRQVITMRPTSRHHVNLADRLVHERATREHVVEECRVILPHRLLDQVIDDAVLRDPLFGQEQRAKSRRFEIEVEHDHTGSSTGERTGEEDERRRSTDTTLDAKERQTWRLVDDLPIIALRGGQWTPHPIESDDLAFEDEHVVGPLIPGARREKLAGVRSREKRRCVEEIIWKKKDPFGVGAVGAKLPGEVLRQCLVSGFPWPVDQDGDPPDEVADHKDTLAERCAVLLEPSPGLLERIIEPNHTLLIHHDFPLGWFIDRALSSS
ncbi:MAG TPA: hypothetical protein VM694_40810 [Polyangium sp.]|nr:hypothetical protein [Polyangium sp.]